MKQQFFSFFLTLRLVLFPYHICVCIYHIQYILYCICIILGVFILFSIRESHTANVVGLFDNSIGGKRDREGYEKSRGESVKCIIRLIEYIYIQSSDSFLMIRFVMSMWLCEYIANFVIVSFSNERDRDGERQSKRDRQRESESIE